MATTQPSVLSPEGLEARLTNLLTFVEDGAKTGVAFANEQIPLVVQEIINWGFWSAIFRCVLFGLLGLAFAWFARSLFRDPECTWKNSSTGTCECVGIFCALTALCFVGLGCGLNGYTAVKTTVAPRLYVIEYVADTIKSMK